MVHWGCTGKGTPGQKGETMLAFAFLATATLYGLAVIAWEEARR